MPPVSFADVNVDNLELTPAKVVFDGVDLGATLKNVMVSTKYTKSPLKADQYGTTILDRRVSGIEITVTTELAEVLDKNKWKVAFPHADLVSSGPNSAIVFRSKVGQKDQDLAKVLQLFPLSQNSGDTTFAYQFFRATSSAESQITMGPEEQESLKVVWTILPDLSQTPARFYVFGDPSIGLIDPVAAAPVAGGSNVGNGVITNANATIDAVTETVTVLCIGLNGPDSGNFYVSGDISGPLGLVELPGSPGASAHFNGSVLTFDIADGSTDFAVGDVFTIGVTGGNYV